jgi:transposase-like protein
MINSYPRRKCARIVGIGISTSFYLRYRILDAIRVDMGIGNVSSVLEVDY